MRNSSSDIQRPRAATRALSPVSGLGELVRQFTPNWFAVTMGTGIVFSLLLAVPFKFAGQYEFARLLWALDCVAYVIFTGLFVARFVAFPETIRPLLDHPVQSMFFGAIPMGLIPIVNGLMTFGGPLFGPVASQIAFALWCLDAVVAVAVACVIPYRMFTSQNHSTEKMTAVWLLPVVGPEVTASSAGVLAPHMPHAIAQVLVGLGYTLWAVSVPLAFSILTIVIIRMALHKLPHRDMGPSSWLTLGPIGTGSLGLLVLGQAAPAAFANTQLAEVAAIARALGVIGGLMLWGAGVWWLILATSFTVRYFREGMTFNMGWWAFTFPIGVFATASLVLYHVTGFALFEMVGIALSVATAAFWVVVATNTTQDILRGSAFHAPCLVTVTP
jgi:C4-dicarboxylate transporter/malic acid transport protein